jgi:hypothetical protein
VNQAEVLSSHGQELSYSLSGNSLIRDAQILILDELEIGRARGSDNHSGCRWIDRNKK